MMNSKLDKIIIERSHKFDNKFSKVLKYIKKYNRIAIFRHARPDYDALGSQLGLLTWINDNFKNKEVIYIGDDHVSLTPKCFPKMKIIDDEWFEKPFLAIVLDTANSHRISGEAYKKADYIIKIDHHPNVDKYAKLEIVDPTYSAAGELLANMLLKYEDYFISSSCATYLFKAIVGDSNRFLYSDVNAHTFAIAEQLTLKGVDIVKAYSEMYINDISSLNFTKWVLDNYIIDPCGIAYYVMEKKHLEMLHVEPERAKDCLYLFEHLENIRIWMSVSWDEPKGVYRVSLRSNGTPINAIASKYNGGGHSQASGAKIKSLDDLPKLLNDLKDLLK